MKRYFVFFLLLIPALVNGRKAGSVKYYQQELSKISRSYQQTL
ncbi:MAG TPA: hypothetical protein VHK69_05455 [Chitinophagaceae bacterium]|nr:hypothetical protein [Chitinophagaceae bacterium]